MLLEPLVILEATRQCARDHCTHGWRKLVIQQRVGGLFWQISRGDGRISPTVGGTQVEACQASCPQRAADRRSQPAQMAFPEAGRRLIEARQASTAGCPREASPSNWSHAPHRNLRMARQDLLSQRLRAEQQERPDDEDGPFAVQPEAPRTTKKADIVTLYGPQSGRARRHHSPGHRVFRARHRQDVRLPPRLGGLRGVSPAAGKPRPNWRALPHVPDRSGSDRSWHRGSRSSSCGVASLPVGVGGIGAGRAGEAVRQQLPPQPWPSSLAHLAERAA